MKQWVMREELNEKAKTELGHLPEFVGRFLFSRNIRTKKEADDFFSLDYESDVYDPLKMLDMEKAVGRILVAIKNKEKIIVFADYDADGVCSATVFCGFLEKINYKNYHVHIPDRNSDGYSLNKPAIEEFKKLGAGLIITFDCGITDKAEVDEANNLGMDVIITDHHLVVPGMLPNAFAIVNSKQENDDYPFKFLCGAGVAFKLVCALSRMGGEQKIFNIPRGWEKWLLDVVAIATIADMAPLTGENRILVHYGLIVLSKTKRPGLKSFYKKFRVDPRNLTEEDISFTVAPRINVASRIDHATTSFNLLATESQEDANRLADKLDSLNNKRKKITSDVVEEILEKFGSEKDFGVLACGNENWHPGILGLAANKLMEKYERPIFLWGSGNSLEFKGSCRSDGSVNLVEFMSMVPKGILADFGGHSLAGGFSVIKGKEEDFKKELAIIYDKIPKQNTDNGTLFIDDELKIDDIDWKFYSQLEKLGPFGIDNPKPIFGFRELETVEVKKFGGNSDHWRLVFKKKNGEPISAISFFGAGIHRDFISEIVVGKKIDLAATIEKNTFFVKPELRMKIIDVKLK